MLVYQPQAQTTDATPKNIFGGPTLPPDSIARLNCFVLAMNHSGGVAIWTFITSIRRIGSGAPQIIVSLAIPAQKSAAAALWDANLVVVGEEIVAQVTGGLGQTIDWLFFLEEPFAMAGAFPG